MKKRVLFICFCLLLATAFDPFVSFAGSKIEKSPFESNTYTVKGKILLNDNVNIDETKLDFEIPAGKTVVLSYFKGYKNIDNYQTTYIGLKDENGVNLEIWSGGHTEPSRMRYFQTTEKQHGFLTVVAGLKKINADIQTTITEWEYEIGVKIFDSPEYISLDSLGEQSGDRNFFISSGPESIFEGDFCAPEYRQYLCRAPINSNANIYWSHMNKTGKDIYLGILLTNKSGETLNLTVNSLNYQNAVTKDDEWSTIYHKIFTGEYGSTEVSHGGFGIDGAVLEPGESAWLLWYCVPVSRTGETTGIANISVNGGEYRGYDLICTSYAFAELDMTEIIPSSFADWEIEAKAATTSMRGSGNGAVLEMNGSFEIPFQVMLAGENIINESEKIILSRLENGEYYSLEDKGNMRRIKLGADGSLPEMSGEEKMIFDSYNCNFGTIYKLDLKKIVNAKTLRDGKKAVGKIKLSSRSTPAISQTADLKQYNVGLNAAVWRTKNGVIDMREGVGMKLTNMDGIDPAASDRIAKADEGICYIFDPNMPVYDTDNDYSYYFVGSGMSFFPFEISVEYEDIELKEEPFSVYLNDKPVDFNDQKPIVIENRTYVPIRAIFEAMGADLFYENSVAAAFFEDKILKISIGSEILEVYDLTEKTRAEIKTDGKARIVGGRTLVPLRAVSESLGCRVDFDKATTAILIYN